MKEVQRTMAEAIEESSRNDMEVFYDVVGYLAMDVNSTTDSTVFTFEDGSTITVTGAGVVH